MSGQGRSDSAKPPPSEMCDVLNTTDGSCDCGETNPLLVGLAFKSQTVPVLACANTAHLLVRHLISERQQAYAFSELIKSLQNCWLTSKC